MKREDIEKAAKEATIKVSKSIADIPRRIYYEQAFKKGAKWRINSVWHKPQEMPKKGVFVLSEDERDGHFSIYMLVGQNWKAMVEDFRVIRWAYIEDLLPNMEE